MVRVENPGQDGPEVLKTCGGPKRILIRIAQDDPLVTERVPPNQAEKEIATGQIRLRWLTPFAKARLGLPYEVWDGEQGKMVVHDKRLSLRPVVGELARILHCGTDFVFELVSRLERHPGGPEGATAEMMMKVPQGGGGGGNRLGAAQMCALNDAIWSVIVTNGRKRGARALAEIRSGLKHSDAFDGGRIPCSSTITRYWDTDEIRIALADPYSRDHLNRVCGSPDSIQGLNAVLSIDCSTMEHGGVEVRALDDKDRDLGVVTCIWGINSACRGVWTVLAFPGAQNGFLVGQALRLAFIDKKPILAKYGLADEEWPFHGKPGEIRHDHGTEFINKHIERALRSRDIAIPCIDRSPAKTPHYRGGEERFNSAAQWLFMEFLNSEQAKAIKRNVPGKPNAIGIRLSDLNRALVTWVVRDWNHRSHTALGGDSPLSRWEKYVRGQNGLPFSGVPVPLEDSDELRWEFLKREFRTVNQLGIQFKNRNYRSSDLNCFLAVNSRSSGKKIEFGYNPYHMGEIFVRVPSGRSGKIVPIPWLPIDEKFRPSIELAQQSADPTEWEWTLLYRDLKAGNTTTVSKEMLEDLHQHREELERSGRTGKVPVTQAAGRAMREFATESLPRASVFDSASPEEGGQPSPAADHSPGDRPKRKPPVYLPVGDFGSDEY